MTVQSAPTRRTTAAAREPRVRPLLVRAGAQFDCFGDGLCCTDIHALGPVTPKEKREVELLAPGVLVRNKDLRAPVFRTQESGACVLRSSRGCELHAVHGPQAKPSGCWRFPYGLVATPEGGRITTEHRCPCRSLGVRPAITPEGALSSLVDAAGRLSPNGRVGPRVSLALGRYVGFARYRALEAELIARLLGGEDPLQVLGKKPFGKLNGERWPDIIEGLLEDRDGTAYGEALAWFSRGLRAGLRGEKLEMGPRPWAWAFDRAEARGGRREAREVLADWLADLLWSLDWVFSTSSFQAGLRELATLYSVASLITQRLTRARLRPDRAAAEAVMVVELARQSGAWERVQQAL